MKGPVQYYRPYSGRDTTHIDEDCTNTVESGCLLCRCPSTPPIATPTQHPRNLANMQRCRQVLIAHVYVCATVRFRVQTSLQRLFLWSEEAFMVSFP